MDGWMDGWMDVWMDGWMDEWMEDDKYIHIQINRSLMKFINR